MCRFNFEIILLHFKNLELWEESFERVFIFN